MTPTVIIEPQIVEIPADLRALSDEMRAAGKSIGFVPTMGALHAGHRSLIERARRECDAVLVSIFVNPIQFNQREDFDKYPRTIDSDRVICRETRVDVVFIPSPGAMYPEGFNTTVHVAGPVTQTLEGAFRPGHFDGVATVVAKLLIAANPHRAYFGAKDAQQCAVVKRLVADLGLSVEIVVCPTVRDFDGLALSSRNVRLSPENRARALAIPRSLAAAGRLWMAGERDATVLERAIRQILSAEASLEVEYVALVDPETFEPWSNRRDRCKFVIAARIGGVRLIDGLDPDADELPQIRGEGDEPG